MILAAVALIGLMAQDPFEGVPIRQDVLLNMDGTKPRLMMRQPQAPLPTAKIGPKEIGFSKIKPEYDYITWGFVRLGAGDEHELRFRVYSQERKLENDPALGITRMLLRLWDLNQQRLKIDHSPREFFQLVNVYLTWGGKAGSEQFLSADIENGRRVTANNIFIYDIASFKEPVEMAREVAHEYGHATLPAIGVYKAPENWANGFLGEKLYLSWLRDMLVTEALSPDDMLGVTAPALDQWVRANVDPIVATAASSKPSIAALSDTSAKGMDTYVGFATYMGMLLPHPVFGRSLKLIGSQEAKHYPAAVLLAIEEPAELTYSVSPALRGKSIWVPVGKGRLTGAKIEKLEDGWALVKPGDQPIVLKNERK